MFSVKVCLVMAREFSVRSHDLHQQTDQWPGDIYIFISEAFLQRDSRLLTASLHINTSSQCCPMWDVCALILPNVPSIIPQKDIMYNNLTNLWHSHQYLVLVQAVLTQDQESKRGFRISVSSFWPIMPGGGSADERDSRAELSSLSLRLPHVEERFKLP